MMLPGIDQPPAVSVAEAKVPDEAIVIGVSVAGKHRAYLLGAFVAVTQHVVNDLVGDVPVTVTVFPKTDCVKLFTSKERGAPLDVGLGGFYGKMLLRIGREFYFQDTGESFPPELNRSFPYPNLPFERMTWKAWRTAHPDTDIYVGSNEPPSFGEWRKPTPPKK
jgi:hypothetical protein